MNYGIHTDECRLCTHEVPLSGTVSLCQFLPERVPLLIPVNLFAQLQYTLKTCYLGSAWVEGPPDLPLQAVHSPRPAHDNVRLQHWLSLKLE